MSSQKIVIAAVVSAALAASYLWWSQTRSSDTPTDSAQLAEASPPSTKATGQRANGGGKQRGGKRGDKPTPVDTVQVSQADVPVVYRALGTAIPSAVVTVTSRVNGQLSAVLFQEGELVKQGQLLAKIDPRPYESALGQIQGQALRNQALLKNSQIDLERFKTLQSQDSIASQQVDAQASLVQQYQGTVLADRAAVEAAKLQVAFTQITAPVSGRIGLRQVDAGNNITTTNPIAVINAIHPIHVVFTIPEDQITALIQKMQQRGADRPFAVEAWDKANRRLLAKGRLASLDNQIDTMSGTLKLKAQFANSDQQLFPNQFVNIRLVSDTLRHASVVPLNALQHGPQGDYVYVVKAPASQDANHAARQENAKLAASNATDAHRSGPAKRPTASVAIRVVTVGHSDGEIAAITAGLQAGELVVTSGVDKLRDGAKVVVKQSSTLDLSRLTQTSAPTAPTTPQRQTQLPGSNPHVQHARHAQPS